MGHSVGDAAKRSTAKGDAAKTVNRTVEQIIADIRRNLAARFAVTPDDQRVLFAEYLRVDLTLDEAKSTISDLKREVADLQKQVLVLTAKNEEFRSVYEAENSSQTLKVETLASGEAGTAGAKGTTGASGMAGAVPTE